MYDGAAFCGDHTSVPATLGHRAFLQDTPTCCGGGDIKPTQKGHHDVYTAIRSARALLLDSRPRRTHDAEHGCRARVLIHQQPYCADPGFGFTSSASTGDLSSSMSHVPIIEATVILQDDS